MGASKLEAGTKGANILLAHPAPRAPAVAAQHEPEGDAQRDHVASRAGAHHHVLRRGEAPVGEGGDKGRRAPRRAPRGGVNPMRPGLSNNPAARQWPTPPAVVRPQCERDEPLLRAPRRGTRRGVSPQLPLDRSMEGQLVAAGAAGRRAVRRPAGLRRVAAPTGAAPLARRDGPRGARHARRGGRGARRWSASRSAAYVALAGGALAPERVEALVPPTPALRVRRPGHPRGP